MSERASRSRIPGLDGLRGLAAMLVLVAHLSQWGYSLIPGLDLSGIGASGVMLFFVLSSFLLTSQILGWSPDAIVKLKPWLLYFEARCLRIWPLYLVVLLVSLTSTYLHYIPIGWKAAPFLEHVPVPMTVDSLREHLLLQTGEDILWTIPIEFKFYLLLPFLLIAIVLPLHNHQGATISVVGAGILAADWQISTEGGGADPVPFIGVFLTGMLLAFVWCNGRRTRIFGKRQRIFYECLAWLCSAIYVCLIPSVYL